MIDITKIWPGAFLKTERENDYAMIREYFIAEGERYSFDGVCWRQGFYQYDTPQDAWYFGLWVRPDTLEIVASSWPTVRTDAVAKKAYYPPVAESLFFCGIQ